MSTAAALTAPAGPTTGRRLSLTDRLDQTVFDAIYSRALVYNACWEDPAVDRRALALGPSDTVLVITSAGCNALDYALAGAGRVHAVDANPRQTALLELKLAGIRTLEFGDFFALFGGGTHRHIREMYRAVLRGELSEPARAFWDRRLHWFEAGTGRTFYDFGLSGVMARVFRRLLLVRPRMRDAIEALLDARSLDEQREVYDRQVAAAMWTPYVNWVLSRQLTMSMLGVPHPQRKEVERQHRHGIPGFVREAVEYVVRELPLQTNYFWTLYLRGHYAPGNCPEYLTRTGFEALQRGAADRVVPHTCTVTDFLRRTDERVSKFVLLDHMDWMSSYHPQALVDEWNAILARATAEARVILRSAHASPGYLQTVRVGHGSASRWLPEVVRFQPELAAALSRGDRVHTYAGFHIADVRTSA